MNVTGHVAVAAALDDDPAVWLGAALPDLAGYARHRLVGETDDLAVRRGIALHHRTDDAFHASAWFRALQDRLRPRLEAAGLGRGAARAVAHVGPELLLDRALLLDHDGDAQRRRAVAEITSRRDDLRSLVRTRHAEWDDHLVFLTEVDPPTDDAVADVARRLHRVLARRPRLAFGAELLGPVSDELAAIEPRVTATAGGLVAEVARASA